MNTLRIILVAFVLSSGLAFYSPAAHAQQVDVSLSVFQNDLGPYGRWINSPRYGQVWVYSEPGFRPYYSNGHWDYSDYGWAWISDYDWGWAPFHYGRWEEDPYYGWIWIPGYEWAPAWVSWSEYDGNYGWAPLGFGLSVNVSFGAIPFNRWTFVPRQNICSPNIHDYYINTGRNRGFNNAVVINNVYVNNNVRFYAGPGRRDVERYTRSRVVVRDINYGRPQRYAGNDRRNDNYNSPGRIERPNRNDLPGRQGGSRPSNGFPGRDNNTGRNDNGGRPSGSFPGRNDDRSPSYGGRGDNPGSTRDAGSNRGNIRNESDRPGRDRNMSRPSPDNFPGRSAERSPGAVPFERGEERQRGNMQQQRQPGNNPERQRGPEIRGQQGRQSPGQSSPQQSDRNNGNRRGMRS